MVKLLIFAVQDSSVRDPERGDPEVDHSSKDTVMHPVVLGGRDSYWANLPGLGV